MFIINGTLEHDKRIETMAREELQGYESRARVTYLTDLAPDELIARTKSLPERSIVLYVWQQSTNEQGKVLESADVLSLIARSAPVPIYGMSGNNIGRGIVGGYVFTTEGNANRAAEIALRIANGARAQDIPVENAPALPMFDWRELQRWGIREDRLPPGRIIHFKELTFWKQHKRDIIGVLALVVLQTLLIAYLLLERARRQRAMRGLRESEERFSKAFHSSPQPMSLATPDEGRYIDVNERWLAMSGYARAEVIGHTSVELNIWESQAARAKLITPLKEGVLVRNLETRLPPCTALIGGDDRIGRPAVRPRGLERHHRAQAG
jgi:PAS domain-containing protein